MIKAGDAVKSKVGNKKPTSDEPDEDSDEEYSSDDEEEERVLLGSEVEKDVERPDGCMVDASQSCRPNPVISALG